MRSLLVIGALGLATLGASCATAPEAEKADAGAAAAAANEDEAPDEAPPPPPPPPSQPGMAPVVLEPLEGGGERVGSGGGEKVE